CRRITFQSSPSPKAGSYVKRKEEERVEIVSILSQPEGRELLRYTFMSFELQHDALPREPDTVDSCKTTQIPNYRSNFDAFFDQTRLNMVSYTLSSDTRTKANLPGNCHTLWVRAS
ncbi:MAG TPA: hypothetical protein PKU68_05505, partial [Bacillota bacterium]|nr:hypothetical protein [Bacillota bacterium]